MKNPRPYTSEYDRRQILTVGGSVAFLALLAACSRSVGSHNPLASTADNQVASTSSLGDQLASYAKTIVTTLRDSNYQHDEYINAAKGVYDCDCNGFVGYVLQRLVPAQYAEIPKESTQPRPRAFEYYQLFSSLPSSTPSMSPSMSLPPSAVAGWRRVATLHDVRRGDIIAWRFPTLQTGHDTGHVMIVADPATTDSDGVLTVRVYDSSEQAHINDTRDSDAAGKVETGVGSGILRFQVDQNGAPNAFQFTPTGKFTSLPIAIGRVTQG